MRSKDPLLLVALVLLVGACDWRDRSAGAVEINMDLSHPKALGYYLTRARVELTHASSGLVVDEDLTVNGLIDRAEGTISELRTGAWTLVVTLSEGETVVGTSQPLEVTVTKDQTSKVAVTITSRGFTASACWYLFAKHKFDPITGNVMGPTEIPNPVCRIQTESYDDLAGPVRLDALPPVLEGSAIHFGGDDSSTDTNDSGWVDYTVCLLEPLGSAAVRVRYADDIQGAPMGDVCGLTVDGESVASFNTNTYTTGGWSDYVWTELFAVGSLDAGIHTLRLESTDGGTYGFTVDCVEILRV